MSVTTSAYRSHPASLTARQSATWRHLNESLELKIARLRATLALEQIRHDPPAPAQLAPSSEHSA